MSGAHSDVTLRVAILTGVSCSVITAIYTIAQLDPSPVVQLFLAFGPLIAVIIWLQKDAARTGVGAVHDLGLFLWFAWPVVIPWYAFKTRGPSGWRLLVTLVALILSAYVTGAVVFFVVNAVASR